MINELCGMFTGNNPIPLTGVELRADIAGRGARVKVIQNFLNAEDKAIEAVYKFPLPEGAAICGFRALIDDRIIIGEIEDRDTAFALYDKALSKGDGAYLLDEERPNIFTMSVGNLPPGKKACIELEYVTLMETNGRETRFFLPTTIAPRYTPADMPEIDGIPVDEIVNPPFQLQIPYELSVSISVHGADEIDSIRSPSHPVNIAFPKKEAPIVDRYIIVTFAEEKAAMDRDFILTVTYHQVFSNRAFWCRHQDDIFIQVDLCEIADDQLENIKKIAETESKEMVFVLDCSGSMAGSSIEQAKKAIDILLKALPQDSHFNIYRFGSRFEKKFPKCVPYNETNFKEALSYVCSIDADLGGTEILSPLKDIYKSLPTKGRKRHVVLITDGDISNENEVVRIIKKGADHSVLHSVGIGYSSNEYLIRQAARVAGGACEFVAPGERIEPKVLRLFQKMASSSISDLHVSNGHHIDHAPAYPFLLKGEAVTLFLKTQDGSLLAKNLTIIGSTGEHEILWNLPLQPLSGANIPIPVLWAKEKIRDIEESTFAENGSRQMNRKKDHLSKDLVSISKQYGVISKNTSYVAIEKRAAIEGDDHEIVLRKVPVMLAKGWGGITAETIPLYSDKSLSIVCCSIAKPAFMRKAQPMSYFTSDQQDVSDEDILEMPVFLRRSTSALERSISSSDKKQEELMHILSCQQPQGGFIWSRDVADIFGLSLEELRAMADQMIVKADCDKHLLFFTMLTIELLTKKSSQFESSWRAIVGKSASWLQNELQRCQPTINGIDLENWIRRI